MKSAESYELFFSSIWLQVALSLICITIIGSTTFVSDIVKQVYSVILKGFKPICMPEVKKEKWEGFRKCDR